MSKSIKVNFVFNVINTVMGLLFPLITFPYASRVLMADGIGRINFYSSIISYIVLITGIGIPIYGIREIARVRDNNEELSRTTVEIFLLNFILCVLGYIVVAVMCLTINEIKNDIPLFLVISTTILLSTIGCNWFYSGVEDFKFIAINSLIIRILSLVLLFGLVRTKEDLLYYGIFAVVTNSGNYLINFIGLRRHIDLSLVKTQKLNITRHIKPALTVFLFSIVSSIYVNLDKVMLGFIKDTTSVGYYTAASQISHILLTLVISLGAVLLPRASNLIKNGQMEEFTSLTRKAYHFIVLLSMPIVAGCVVMAPTLIHILCGYSYEPSVTTLRLICPTVFIIGLSQLIGMQILYPLGKIRMVTYSTGIGAIVNVILNSMLIPLFAQNGAAISSVAAELSVTFSLIFFSKRTLPFRFFTSSFFKYLIATFIMALVCVIFVGLTSLTDWGYMIALPVIGGLIYMCILLLLKEEFIADAILLLKKAFKI